MENKNQAISMGLLVLIVIQVEVDDGFVSFQIKKVARIFSAALFKSLDQLLLLLSLSEIASHRSGVLTKVPKKDFQVPESFNYCYKVPA